MLTSHSLQKSELGRINYLKMKKKILFLCTSHFSLDDRIFYHQAQSITNNDDIAIICSTIENLETVIDNISITSFDTTHLSFIKKIKPIASHIHSIKPDQIICDSPLAVLASYIASNKNKHKIVYDITEWYPSKENFTYTPAITIILKFIFLILFSFLAGVISNKFIFGEYYKSVPFKLIFFWKNNIIIPYYPDLKYINKINKTISNNEIELLYAGKINIDKGIVSVFNAVQELAKLEPNFIFKLNIIGKYSTEKNKRLFENLVEKRLPNIVVITSDFLPFREFCDKLGKYDFFFDLRQIDFENNRSLPIKLFYYIACGKPVIYSNLKSIRQDIPNFNFGYLCNPNDSKAIASYISDIINNPQLYKNACKNACHASQNKYHWGIIESSFLDFLES